MARALLRVHHRRNQPHGRAIFIFSRVGPGAERHLPEPRRHEVHFFGNGNYFGAGRGHQAPREDDPTAIVVPAKNAERRTAAHVNMWTSPEDIARHSEDLNVFGGLEFDSRFSHDSDKPSPTPFSDPFPSGALPRAAAGLKPTPTQSAITGPNAEWRDLEGDSFIM